MAMMMMTVDNDGGWDDYYNYNYKSDELWY